MSLTPPEGNLTRTIAYVTKAFPRASETFILDEILGLEASGIRLALFAMSDPAEPMVQPDVARVASTVTYLRPSGKWAARRRTVGNVAVHLGLAARHPRRYARALGRLVSGSDRRTAARHFLDAGRLALHLRRSGAGHIHAAFAHTPASVGYYAHILTGLPFSFAGHAKDLYRSNAHNLGRRAREARLVLACSASARRAVLDKAGPEVPVVLARHGVDVERFSPSPSPSPSRPAAPGGPEGERALRVLAVGRLVPKKGYPDLLEAVALVSRTGRLVRCDIVGDGELETGLRADIERLGLAGVVRLVGERTHQELAAAYRQADVFVQASVVLADGDRDGIPNTLLEAMASATAVVATDVAGIPEVVVDSENGLLVPPRDPKALADAVLRLADDPRLRARLGNAARGEVLARHDRRQCVQRVSELLAAVT